MTKRIRDQNEPVETKCVVAPAVVQAQTAQLIKEDVQKTAIWQDVVAHTTARPLSLQDTLRSSVSNLFHHVVTALDSDLKLLTSSILKPILHETKQESPSSILTTTGLFGHTPYQEWDPFPKKRELGCMAVRVATDGKYEWDNSSKTPRYDDLPNAEKYSALEIFGARALKATVVEATLRFDPNAGGTLHSQSDYITLDDVPSTIGPVLQTQSHMLWDDDRSFGLQQWQGVNPGQIRKMHREEVRGWMGELSERPSTTEFYQTDYEDLGEYAMTPDMTKGANFDPDCIFSYDTANPDKNGLEPEMIRCGGTEGFISVKTDGWKWRYAKLMFGCAQFTHHEIINHLAFCHLSMEVFIMATMSTWRHQSQHPVYNLLVPHFSRTLAVNNFARELLVPWIKQHLTVFTPDSIDRMIAESVKGFNIDTMDFELELSRRGFDPDALPSSYYYAQDGLRIWRTLKQFVSNVLDDTSTTIDFVSIRKWCQAIQAHIPLFPTVCGAERLVDVVTSIIFSASVQHSAVNDPQYFFLGYPPNAICKLMKPIPSSNQTKTWTDNDWKEHYFASLPSLGTMALQKDLVSVLALGAPEASSLQQSVLDDYHTFFPSKLVNELANSLGEINNDILARREYTWLMPSLVTRSVIR